jgi:hypothetical protein
MPVRWFVVGNDPSEQVDGCLGPRRRWLIGLEPIFEGGRHGKRSREWDVEDELVAVAFFGDVKIDLAKARTLPGGIVIEAYAIVCDVDVIVPTGTEVELSGGMLRGELINKVAALPAAERWRTVRVRGHSVLGDVTVRSSDEATR